MPAAPTLPDGLLAADAMTADAFAAHVGTAFTFWAGPPHALVPVALALATVRETGPAGFVLSFRPPAGLALPQGTFPVEHAAMGRMALFVVPLADGTAEAVFNRAPAP